LLLAGVRQMEAESSPLDMASIVANALERLDHMVGMHQADIIVPDAWPTALGYGPWIEEVWANYVSNAIKYGGRPPRVELGYDTAVGDQLTIEGDEARQVRFWVRDNGSGISWEAQSRLFTPFTRLDQVRVEGHGLGLSIVRRIVKKLGGYVGVESSGVPGEGSVFYFSLPPAPPSTDGEGP
jgi:signal transduction histidine kinase